MKRSSAVSRMVVVVLLMVSRGAPAASPAPAPAPAEAKAKAKADAAVRVMSFNIRLATPKDVPGGNGWDVRKEMLFKTIEHFAPDLAGFQEVLPTQAEELKARFAATHDFIGVPRNDGKTSGEMVPVLFRRDRFERVRDGTFWLSDTPETIGSKGWDADLPRIVTWVELRDRQHGNRPILFLNTHFDHLGKVARMESAKLLRRRMLELAGEAGVGGGDKAVVITGDFNTPQYSPPYKELLGDAGAPLRLVETFKEATPKPTSRDYTFHGFSGNNKRADRIDWVLRSDHFKTTEAAIDRTNEKGRYPSDHYPVTAVLRWAK